MNLYNGDCLEVLKSIDADSIDSLVTDPPAGISFMGKEWDSDKGGRDGWIAWMTEIMSQCLRVMKPGAHGLVWALPRTSHWTATALEDAGFEVRDVVTHLFGSGFPKSLNVSKAGAGEAWAGWGTALKPASEHWILIRKPLGEKTVAANTLKHGTGGINIDASRIEGAKASVPQREMKQIHGGKFGSGNGEGRSGLMSDNTQGRFPANLVLSHSEYCADDQCDIECAIKMLDEQSGKLHLRGNKKPTKNGVGLFNAEGLEADWVGTSESGHAGASRFFYCAKISTSERNAGLEDMPKKSSGAYGEFSGDGRGRQTEHAPSANHHPTVKPKKLMSYFIRMITPPGGTVLDPFMGSGSTGIAAKECNFEFVGIEKEKEYFEISEKRIGVLVEPVS